MSPPRYPPAMGRRNRCSPAKKLDKKPKPQHDNCRQFYRLPDNKQGNKNKHPRPWEGNHISAQHSGYCPACPDTRDSGLPIKINMYNGRTNSTDEIKQNEFEASQLILDIIAKNPQIPHIPYEMNEPSVKEHRTEKREVDIYKSGTRDICGIVYFDRNNAKLKEERIQLASF